MTPKYQNTLVTLCICIAIISNAFGAIMVVDFGLAGNTTFTTTVNQAAESPTDRQDVDIDLLDTTGAVNGVHLISDIGLYSGFRRDSFRPAGGRAYIAGGNTVVDDWIANEQVAYGDIWQGLAEPETASGEAVNLTFSDLKANTTYTIDLLSVRASNYGGTNLGNYNLEYDGATLAGGGSHQSRGNRSGRNATQYTWTFTTDDAPQDAILRLSGSWNMNALIITEAPIVPEPSALLLVVLVGSLSALRRRRAA